MTPPLPHRWQQVGGSNVKPASATGVGKSKKKASKPAVKVTAQAPPPPARPEGHTVEEEQRRVLFYDYYMVWASLLCSIRETA